MLSLIAFAILAMRIPHHPPHRYFVVMGAIVASIWIMIILGYNASGWDAPLMFLILAFWGNMLSWIPCAVNYLCFQRRTVNKRIAAIEGQLPELLADGTIRLLRVAWLLAQPEDYILQRRQDLPEEAFVPTGQAKKLLRARKVAVLSYRWLTAAHPDPEGFHMDAIRTFFRSHKTRTALFWDFASCFQKERTAQEDALFKIALSAMTCLYASPHSLVIQHKRLPAAGGKYTPIVPTFPHEPAGIADYEHSGWCTMEQAASSLATVGGGSLFTLGVGKVRLHTEERRTPSEMAAIFADERRTRFLGKADREFVGQMYAEFHAKMEAFDMTSVPWINTCNDRVAKETCLRPYGCVVTTFGLTILGVFCGASSLGDENLTVRQIGLFGTIPFVMFVVFVCFCSSSPLLQVEVRRRMRGGRIAPGEGSSRRHHAPLASAECPGLSA